MLLGCFLRRFFAGGIAAAAAACYNQFVKASEVKAVKKYALPLAMLAVFEAIAVTLWLTKDNIFYLFNFSYIGMSIALGLFLLLRKHKYARRIVQLLVGIYLLVYLGLICGENMQIEGFWYYLFTGVFEAATIHYAVAKIFGPLLFGRGWCGYACWTAMVLDFAFKDNRAFCKYLCPITVFLKPMSYFSLVRITCDKEKCTSCGACKRACPMDVDVTDNARSRKNGTECILCLACVKHCPKNAL